MHGIVKPIDIVLSTQGAEWHGLADVVPAIDDVTIAPLLFPIRTGKVTVEIDGEHVPMHAHKALVADMRHRADLIGTDDELVPLHIPKNGYRPIENGEMWNVLKDALKDVGAVVSSAGTLQGGRKFFVSVDFGDTNMKINGEDFRAYLNFATSHDGTLAAQAYSSFCRIVCRNTLIASLAAAGDVGFKVYHTAGAQVAVANMGALLNSILTGREQFKTDMEYLASVSITSARAESLFAGYFAMQQDKDELAKRSLNHIADLTGLFSGGIECHGKSLADVLNAATQFWTHENGTGKKADKIEKAYKASFGTAADHKRVFFNYLVSADMVAKLIEKGDRALRSS